MKAPVGIIDLGTNTFHLLIAGYQHGTLKIQYRDKQGVRIGHGGISKRIITEEAQQRAIRTLLNFNEVMTQYGVEQVYAYGTSAVRNAGNRNEFIDNIRLQTGIDITVLSGDEEAAMIFDGIRYALNLGHEQSLVVDIGGGSVEFIIGNGETVFWKRSFEIGGQRLMDMFQHHDPILPEEIYAMDLYFAEQLQELHDAVQVHQPVTLIGSSGSFDTLSDIYCLQHQLPQSEDDPETPLTIEGFYAIHHELLTKNHNERMQIPGMIELRVDMIVVASCLIRYLIDTFGFTRLRVSGYSLKEGALYRLHQTS
ncbi:MAG: exopolyphosphatase [Cyclobacteriaceae bacterium]|jgi:exopolyphosphatase/guanosine-5'-triphosphate,3'-diphosphate pyrophosphatase|nr:exopolyphosphatase [Cyclobacteriaceae bacterium]